MFEISTSPQSVIGVLRNSVKLFKKTWLKLLPISMLMVGLVIVLSMLLPKQQLNLSAITRHMSTNYLIISVIFDVIVFWLFLVMFHRCYQIIIAADSGYYKSAMVAVRKFLPCFVALFVYIFAVVLGAICFVIPGIFLLILLVYCSLGILIDNQTVFASFAYSARLIWGNWWRTFAVFLLALILVIIAMLLVIVITSLIFIYLFHLTTYGATIAMDGAAIVLVLFMWIILTNVFVCQYYDLKLRQQLKR